MTAKPTKQLLGNLYEFVERHDPADYKDYKNLEYVMALPVPPFGGHIHVARANISSCGVTLSKDDTAAIFIDKELRKKTEELHNTIIHEVVHAVHKILYYFKIDTPRHCEELYAYLIGDLSAAIIKKLNGH